MRPFIDSTDIQDDGMALRERMERDGYLFVRGILPNDILEETRLSWLELLRDAGCVDRSALLADGTADMSGFRVEPQEPYMNVLVELYRKPQFQAIQHHSNLVGLIERMIGEPVVPHPRVIARYIFPQKTEFTTPPHQDWIPIQGTEATYTAWVPFSNVPQEMGGLQICAGSHRGDIYQFRPALGAGGLEITDELPDDWRYNPTRQGDVILFHSLTVHKGMPCRGEQLRLSMDARYQSRNQPLTAQSLAPHCVAVAGWEEIYRDWPATADPYKYYWQEWDLHVADYDDSYNRRRDKLALEMAEAGDRRALSVLQRIIARDPDPGKRERAQQLLTKLECENG